MKATTVLLLKKSFVGELNQILLPPKNPKYTMLDIYSGCGGLSLGFEAAGFKSTGIDADKNCCRTYNHNLVGSCKNDFITPKYEFPEADIVVGGSPCQPFSVNGKQLGQCDKRNAFIIKTMESDRAVFLSSLPICFTFMLSIR